MVDSVAALPTQSQVAIGGGPAPRGLSGPDRPDPVSGEVWDEAARHYAEPQLAALVVAIAAINAFNRVNAATRQITGDYVTSIVEATTGAAA